MARLLSKANVAKVAAKPKLASVTEAESTMQNALEIANSLGGIDIVLKPLGQLFVRVGLLITDKGKQGREHTVFTLQEIQQAFLEGVGEAVGKRIVFDEWAGTGTSQEGAKPPPKSSTAVISPPAASLSDHNSPIWIAGQSGFQSARWWCSSPSRLHPKECSRS